jgi:hypothetical protein
VSTVTVYPVWGQHNGISVPTPSWMAPPLPELRLDPGELPPLRVSVPPPSPAGLYDGSSPTIDSIVALIGDLPVEPPPPPAYPDLRADYAALEAQLKATVDTLASLRRQILEASEPALVKLASAIGGRIAGQELRLDPGIIVGWAQEAIEQLASDDPVVVAISSDIAIALEEAAWAPLGASVSRIETDPTLAPASCEIRSASASVDASLAGRTEAINREVAGSTT